MTTYDRHTVKHPRTGTVHLAVTMVSDRGTTTWVLCNERQTVRGMRPTEEPITCARCAKTRS